jgi:uncharacterized membrane protein
MAPESADAEFPASAEVPDKERNLVVAVYVLQAVSFLVGVTLLIGVIVNYVKRADVAGTWLAAHHRWQIRTFWFFLLWGVIGAVASLIAVGYLILAVNAIWLIYRIIKGWLALSDGKSPYPDSSV